MIVTATIVNGDRYPDGWTVIVEPVRQLDLFDSTPLDQIQRLFGRGAK